MNKISKIIFNLLYEIGLIACMTASTLSGICGNKYSMNFLVFFGFLYLGAIINHNMENTDD